MENIVRPQTTPARTKSHPSGGRTPRSRSAMQRQRPEQQEMARYDWPDLPPLSAMKTAISRTRISEGISYLLPVNKPKSATQTTYQTNLRAMFQEPYRSEPSGYDETRIRASARHHFDMKTVPSPYKREYEDISSYKLNKECETIRQRYSQSAPARGLTGRTTKAEDIRMRSSLYLPLKAKVPEEAIKLKEEADKILKSVQETEKASEAGDETIVAASPDLMSSVRSERLRLKRQKSQDASPGVKPFIKKTAAYKDYKDFIKDKPSPKPVFPDDLRTPYLSDNKAHQIWDWLHHDETITRMSHFISVCT